MGKLRKTRVLALVMAVALALQLPQALLPASAVADSGAQEWIEDTVQDSGMQDSGLLLRASADAGWVGGTQANSYITKVELHEGNQFNASSDAPLGHTGGTYDPKNDADLCDVYDSGSSGNTVVSNLTTTTAKDADVMAVYWFRVPNDDMNESDNDVTCEMGLPEEIVFGNPNGESTARGEIKTIVDGVEILVASYTVTGNMGKGHLQIIYHGTAASKVRGGIAIAGKLNKEALGNTGNETLEFPLNASESLQEIPIKFAPETEKANVTIKKELVGDKDDGNGIFEWKITVAHSTTPTANLTIPDTVFTDEITDPHDYVADSFKVDGTTVADLGVYAPGTSPENPKLTYEFPADFNTTPGKTETVITYKTDINIDKALAAMGTGTTARVENEAKLTYPLDVNAPEVTPLTSNKPHYNYPLDLIKKTGAVVSVNWGYGENSQVKWTITLNSSKLNFNHIPVFMDELQSYLKLVSNSVKLDGVELTENTDYTYAGGSDPDKWGGTLTTTNTNNRWLDGAEHKLTFITDVKDDYFLNNYPGVYNKATLKVDTATPSAEHTVSSGGVGPGGPSSMLEKTNKGYNKATHSLSWQVVINANSLSIENAVLADKFAETGKEEQELIPNSIRVYEGNGTTGTEVTSQNMVAYNAATGSRGLTGTFGTINEPYTIMYQTRAMSADIWGKNDNNQIKNEASFTWNMSNSGPQGNVKDDATQPTTSQVISKAAGKYDYEKQETTWTITVNQNGMAVKDCVITDIVPAGQEYVENSATVTTAANPIAFSKVVATPNADGGQDVALTVAGEFSTQQTITLRTKLTDLDKATYINNVKVQLHNKAQISGTDVLTSNPFVETTFVTKEIQKDVITKEGKAYPGDGCIVWTVELNRAQARLSNLKLTDTLPENLILWENDEKDIHTVRLYEAVVGATGAMTKGNEVKNLLTVTYNQNNPQTCTFQFKENIDKAYILEFSTGVKVAGHKTFTNSMTLMGTSGVNVQGGSSAVEGQFSANNGWGVGTNGKIVLKKIDANNPAKTLAGAKFQLYDPLMNQTITQFTEDKAKGTYTFTGLYLGRAYQVTETQAPEGYALKTEAKPITAYDAATSPTPTEFKNDPAAADGRITVKKVDAADGDALEGAKFQLTGGPVNGTPTTTEKTTGSDGTATFVNLAYGVYTLTEMAAPTDYDMPTNPVISNITVSGDKTVFVNKPNFSGNESDQTITVKNTADATAVKITVAKMDKQTQKRMPGVAFTLAKADGTVTLSGTTNAQGLLTWSQATTPALVYGTYTLTETAAPAGYKLAPPQTVALSAASKVITVQVQNEPLDGALRLTKTDAANGKPLAGALFSLTGGHTGKTYTGTTDANGLIEWKDLPYGSYTLTETKAPADEYELAEPREFTINAETNAKHIELTIANKPKGGDVVLTKQDARTGNPLAEAVFELTGPAGTPALATTGEDGTAKFDDLAYGEYALREHTAPVGYTKSDAVQKFTVGADNLPASKHFTFTVKNNQIPGRLTVVKADARDSAKLLPGAEFALLGDGAELERQTTDETGVAVFQTPLWLNVAYTVKETVAPAGYVLAPEEREFSVTASALEVQLTFQNSAVPPKKPGGGKSPWVPEPQAPSTDGPPVTSTVEVKTPPVATSSTESGEKSGAVDGKVEVTEGAKTTIGTPPKNGTVEVTPDGKWSYTPEVGYHGTDEFTVNIRNADGTEEAVRVLVTIADEEIPLTGGTGLIGLCVVGASLIAGGVLLRRKK